MGLDNPIHIAFLLILLLLVFGAKRLPEMGRSLGSGMRGFKDSLSGEETNASMDARQQPVVAMAEVPAAPIQAARVSGAPQPAVVPEPAREKLPA